jgi:hypothetical protein
MRIGCLNFGWWLAHITLPHLQPCAFIAADGASYVRM